jgi:DNA-binding transcriptional MerR regulator
MESKPPMAPSADDNVTFSISDLAREFDITPRTIRFWEDQGLLFPRREGQTRVFSRRDRTRLKLALRGKRLGLSLARIKEMIEMYDTARDESSQLLKFLDVLSERRAAYERQREDIAAVLDEIAGFEQVCRELLAQEAATGAGSAKDTSVG